MHIQPHVRPIEEADVAAVVAIYNHYVENSVATFEEAIVSELEFQQRINAVAIAKLPWLVIESGGVVCGYAYASPWRARSAYRFSTEVSVYVDQRKLHHGHGQRLYNALLERLREKGLKTAIAVVTLPNDASQKFHDSLGFEKVAHLSKVGLKFDRWLDVGYWQLML